MPKVPGFQASGFADHLVKVSTDLLSSPDQYLWAKWYKVHCGAGAKAKHNGREVQVQGQEAVEGGASDQSWGLTGGYTGAMWHPSWALKNEEAVAGPGQWRRHLAEGPAGAKAERREIAWRAGDPAIKLQPGRGGEGRPIHKKRWPWPARREAGMDPGRTVLGPGFLPRPAFSQPRSACALGLSN